MRVLSGTDSPLGTATFALVSVDLLIGLVVVTRESRGCVRTVRGIATAVSVLIAFHGLPCVWLPLVAAGVWVTRSLGPKRVAVVGVVFCFAQTAGDYLTDLQVAQASTAVHIAPWARLGVTVWATRRVWTTREPESPSAQMR